MLTDELIQNYLSDSQKVIHDKVLGIDVKISVDTIFKKYTIVFADKDQKKMAMVFNYERDYFLDDKSKNVIWNKLYLMEFNGLRFFLIDYLDAAPFYELEIRHDKLLPITALCSIELKMQKNN